MAAIEKQTESDINNNKDAALNESITQGKKDVVQILVDKNVITKDQLKTALEEYKMRTDDSRLIDVILDLGFIPESALIEIISGNKEQEDDFIDVRKLFIDTNILRLIPQEFANEHKVIVAQETDEHFVIVTSDIYNIFVLDRLSSMLKGKKMIVKRGKMTDIQDIIDRAYKYSSNVLDILEEIDSMAFSGIDLESDPKNSPIPRFIDAIMADAVKIRASDIHIEPGEYFVRVRLRIDGVLVNRFNFHIKHWDAVCVRLKIISEMNIAESRKPQDGGISMVFFGRKIDFRVSSIPTVFGENFVLRILDNSKSITTLEELGYTARSIEMVDLMLKKPEGIIIVTGPTGSGKTTTLYSILDSINSIHDNIMTLEEPVEYRLPIIRQSEINHKAGFDFGSGLRSLLRQDPDIIFLGEIRDQETAMTALRASATGHQVFSTLHTNSAMAAITRLLDIGIESYLLADAIVGIIAQRLTRKLCDKCKVKTVMSPHHKEIFGLKKDRDYYIYQKKGCAECDNIGFRGRIVVAETLFVNEEFKFALAERASIKELSQILHNTGFISMQKDGIMKILSGHTTIEELSNVVDMTSYFSRVANRK